MKRVLTFAAVLMFASMFTVSQAQAHSHGSSCGGSRGSSHCGSHHDGHHGCNGSNCNGKGCNGKNGNPDGWNTIHPIPAPPTAGGGIFRNPRFPFFPPTAFGNPSGNLTGMPSGHGLYTGNLHQWGLGGPAGRPPMASNNGQNLSLGGFAGYVGKEFETVGSNVLNAGNALLGGVAKGVGATLGGVANGVGSVLSGAASGVGDVVSGIGSAISDLF